MSLIKKLHGWLFMLPVTQLVLISIMLGLAPFVPEPHLLEKLRMLMQGELTKPIDIFDLFMHGTPALLLLLRFTLKAPSDQQVS